MTKEEAKDMLERWIEHKMKYTDKMTLPIVDEVCASKIDTEKNEFSQYTFKGLIKIAYDLN